MLLQITSKQLFYTTRYCAYTEPFLIMLDSSFATQTKIHNYSNKQNKPDITTGNVLYL